MSFGRNHKELLTSVLLCYHWEKTDRFTKQTDDLTSRKGRIMKALEVLSQQLCSWWEVKSCLVGWDTLRYGVTVCLLGCFTLEICSETSATDCHLTLSNNPEERGYYTHNTSVFPVEESSFDQDVRAKSCWNPEDGSSRLLVTVPKRNAN